MTGIGHVVEGSEKHLLRPAIKKGKVKTMNSRKAVAALTAFLSFTLVGSNFLVPDFRGYDDTLLPIPLPDPLIVPAAYAFAIWGPIFIWLIIGLVWAPLHGPTMQNGMQRGFP